MLPVHKLLEKISEAYDHALHERVGEFQEIDKGLTSLVPLYVQQINYSSQAVRNLNMVQISTMFTQIAKVVFTAIMIAVVTGIFLVMPFFEGVIAGILSGVTLGFGLYYAWKKVPILRSIWDNTRQLDVHSANMYIGISECIRALEEIKTFQQATVTTIEEWERKGLLKDEAPDEETIQKASDSIDNFLESLANRDFYKTENEDQEPKE